MEPTVIERDMAVSHADFRRTLPAALGRRPSDDGNGTFILADGRRKVTIALGPEEERALGQMRFPRTRVRIELSGYDEADVKAFLERFDAYFRRGGG